MGRFRNLELPGRGEDGGPTPSAGPAPEVRDEQHYLRRADELSRAGSFEKALRLYSRALEFNPNLETGWRGQVRMLIELGELNETILWADKALEIFRDDAEILAAKAVAHVRLGDGEKGIAFSDASLQGKGSSPYAWIARGEVMLAGESGNDDYCFMKARTCGGGDWFVELLIARAYYFYRHYAKALKCAMMVTAARADSAFAWHVLGDCQLALGMEAPARVSYGQALSVDPGFERSLAALKRIRGRGPLERAFAWFTGLFRGRRGI